MQLQLFTKNRNLKLLTVVLVLGLLHSCKKFDHWPPRATEERADVVYGWYKFIAIIQRPVAPQPNVILCNRNFGFIGVGLYESVRPGIKGAVSLSSKLYQMPQMPATEKNEEYLWSAAANAYLASMFKQILPGLTDANKVSIDSLEEANNKLFKLYISADVVNRSQAFGRAIATAIFNWSTTDNFNISGQGWVLPVFPGAWVPTPPAFANPVGPFLKDSRPFLEYTLTAKAPDLPFPYSEDPNSEFYKAVKEVFDIGNGLTTEQKAIADWFADSGGPGVGVPAPYHLLSIVTGLLESRKADLAMAAEIYAKTGIAQKDGGIITFRDKFKFNLIRPVTYIQQHLDSNWLSYLVTPPYPEYTSGLVGFYGPIMQVLKRELGDIRVSDNTYAWRGSAPRNYASISKLLEEAAVSRIYGGLHYRFTQNISVDFGEDLGNKIADINLKGGSKH